MRHLAYIVLTTCFFVGVAVPAHAEFVNMTKVSESTLKSKCAENGGSFNSNSSGYSCEKANCNGKGGVCGVYCGSEPNCTGVTPGRIVFGSAVPLGALVDLVMQPAAPTTPQPNAAPQGSMSSQSTSTEGGTGIIFN